MMRSNGKSLIAQSQEVDPVGTDVHRIRNIYIPCPTTLA